MFGRLHNFYSSEFRVKLAGLLRRSHVNWPTVLVVIGCVLLIYVGTQYGEMFMEQHSLQREWETQQSAVHLAAPTAGELVEQGLTRISIPKIDLSAVVVEGTDRRSLNLGPGHLTGSAFPGTPGNSVLTAHRDSFFRHIVELTNGDQVMVQRNGKSYTYEVVGKQVVKPTETEAIQPTKDNRLTLITCYPTHYIGPAPYRLIVNARLVGEPDHSGAVAQQQHATSLPGDESSERARQ